jgi:Lipoprotein LpqB beta-propeller domain/Sporulation and spore germination
MRAVAMTEPRRLRRSIVRRSIVRRSIVLALLLALTAGGCGVSRSSSPVDVGDGLAGGPQGDDIVRTAPRPGLARSTENLVRYYLAAAAGGGESSINQLTEFLTASARSAFVPPRNPQNITIIRLLGDPVKGAPTVKRTPVTIRYQTVGVLNDQGRVDELVDPFPKQMTFWVVASQEGSHEDDAAEMRIDQIDPTPTTLMLSDDALVDLYRPAPVYFWDATNSLLIPDIRYLPLTLSTAARADLVLKWLLTGPSPWLPGAQRLPNGTTSKTLISRDGTFVVNLSAQAASGGPDGLRRLLYQLLWSLRSDNTPSIELKIDDETKSFPGATEEYLRYNNSHAIGSIGQKYDIVDQRVTRLPFGSAQPSVLGAKENQTVAYAAVNRDARLAAFVRVGATGQRLLQIVREGTDGRVETGVKRSSDMGRPVWLPSSKDQLLVPSGGRVYAVSATDGRSADVTPRDVGGVTSLAVAPDGRRIALVATMRTYVTSLTVDPNNADPSTVSIGSNLRRILPGQLDAVAVAWASDVWLYVAGSAGEAPAIWRATADSVVAKNDSASLLGLTPTDVVAFPAGPLTRYAEIIVLTNQGAYYLGSSSSAAPAGLRAPFFAS